MAGDEQSGEKTHEATEKKLSDARAQGDVPKSSELVQAATYAAFLLAAMALAGAFQGKMSGVLAVIVENAATIDPAGLWGGEQGPAGSMITAAIAPALALTAAPFVATLAVLAIQRAFVFVPSKLLPKLDRISLPASVKRKYGAEGLSEFAKGLLKAVLVSVLTATVIVNGFAPISRLGLLDPGAFFETAGALTVSLLAAITVYSLMIGAADLFWQRFLRARRLRMSHAELLREMKESEGDPHIKNRRRSRAVEIATNRMLLDVPVADVVIVNPTHFAVALKWQRGAARAPLCVAKGTDEIAARIRQAAARAGVPIHHDAATARSLHATVEIGREILPKHYRPVAVAIRFAEKMRRSKRAAGT